MSRGHDLAVRFHPRNTVMPEFLRTSLAVIFALATSCDGLSSASFSALELCAKLEGFNRRRQLSETIKVFERWHGRQDAAAVAEAGWPPPAKAYVEAIFAHGKRSSGVRALDTFRLMQTDGVTPNLLAYTMVIRACASRKLWPVALSLFEDLREEGLRADTVACNAVLVACERGGQLEEAELLLSNMRAEGPQPDAM